MPSRLATIAILALWVIAFVSLLYRDIVPDWMVGPPPDLRTIARAADADTPAGWTILIADRNRDDQFRPIGQVISRTHKRSDGSVQWSSEAKFDAAELAFRPGSSPSESKRTPRDGPRNTPVDMMHVASVVEIDPIGNLYHLRASLRSETDPEELVTIEGRLLQHELEIHVQSPIPLLRSTKRLPYRTRGVVVNPLNPIDRIPGLRVGQVWESQVANPLTGAAQEVRSEVASQEVIQWGSGPVRTLVVLNRVSPLSFRTWVRAEDGLVLRQEVPFPLARLILERQEFPSPTPAVNSP